MLRSFAMLWAAALVLTPAATRAQSVEQLRGSEKLFAPDRPEDPSNRRVEIRDLGSAN